MKFIPTFVATLFLAAATLASNAQATVLNFNNTSTGALSSSGYTSNGFSFTGSLFLIGSEGYPDASNYAYNGSDYLMYYNPVKLTSSTGAFSLNSIDLAQWADFNNVTAATLTGIKVGGGTVSKVLTLGVGTNNANTSGNDFTTFALSGFDNLASLTFTRNGSYYMAMDNLVLNASSNVVPEPASLALMGLALAGVAAARRRAAKR